MDASANFAEYAVKTSFSDLPEPVVKMTESILCDCISCMIAGSNNPITRKAYSVFRKLGGQKQATVYCGPGRMPAMHAAMINAVAGTCLDYNDLNEPAHTHIGISAVPTGLSVAEWLGNRVSGQDLLCALAVGMELGCRLGLSSVKRVESHVMGGWVYCSLHAAIISAIVAGKLMGLNTAQLRNAIGIAYHQAAGNGQAAFDGTDVRVFGAGFAARNGILAAMLAQNGITGTQDSINASDLSLMHLYHNGERPNVLLNGLGERFELLNTGFKAYPCCGLGHRQLYAVSNAMSKFSLKPDEITGIKIQVPLVVYHQLCEGKMQSMPRNMSAAQFHLPWQIACLIVEGDLTLSQFAESSFHSEYIASVMQKIQFIVDPDLADETVPAELVISTADGDFIADTGACKGSPEQPFSEQDLQDKLVSCAIYGGQLTIDEARNIYDRIGELKNNMPPALLLSCLPHMH